MPDTSKRLTVTELFRRDGVSVPPVKSDGELRVARMLASAAAPTITDNVSTKPAASPQNCFENPLATQNEAYGADISLLRQTGARAFVPETTENPSFERSSNAKLFKKNIAKSNGRGDTKCNNQLFPSYP